MNIHLNVFKANGSKAIRESGWINHDHCVEDVQRPNTGLKQLSVPAKMHPGRGTRATSANSWHCSADDGT